MPGQNPIDLQEDLSHYSIEALEELAENGNNRDSDAAHFELCRREQSEKFKREAESLIAKMADEKANEDPESQLDLSAMPDHQVIACYWTAETPEGEAAFLEEIRQRKISIKGLPAEIRTTNAKTGGQKGKKLARHALIPPEFIHALAEHFGKGAEKYDDHNWARGLDWSLLIDAAGRHWREWLDLGCPDYDVETGSHHLIAHIWHCVILYVYSQHPGLYGEFDDRLNLDMIVATARSNAENSDTPLDSQHQPE